MFTSTLKLFFKKFNLTAQDALAQSQGQLLETISANYDEDEALEIWEQLSFFRAIEHVEKPDVNLVEFDRICTISSPAADLVVQNQQKANSSITQSLDFSAIIKKLSIKSQNQLDNENLDNEIALSRISNDEIQKLHLDITETEILLGLVVQCRINAKTQKTKKRKNAIQKRFPVKSIITKKVLKKNGLDNCFTLYFLTSIKTIHALFEKYPSIPVQDKKNILAGIAIARYLQKKF